MPRPCRVVLLVEDNHHSRLMYRYLSKRRFRPHDIQVIKAPLGAGSAEQWVRERFPVEVSAYRRRQAETKLILVVDADTHTVHDRIRQLDESLQRAGVRQIDENVEQIARLVPKRNIETWILCLNLEQVDEDTDYKRSRGDWTERITVAAAALYEWTRPNASVPASCLRSLQLGITQLVNAGF